MSGNLQIQYAQGLAIFDWESKEAPEHMKNLYEVCIIHSMKSLGLSISKIVRLASCDRKIVCKYLAKVLWQQIFPNSVQTTDDT